MWLFDLDSLVSDETIKSFMMDFTKRIEGYLWEGQGPEWPSRFRPHTLSTRWEQKGLCSHTSASSATLPLLPTGPRQPCRQVGKELDKGYRGV